MFSINFDGDICLSGGADGADLQWGMCAGMAGHQVIHWSFTGHNTQAPPQEVVILDDQQLSIADSYLVTANKTLGRRVPFHKPNAIGLLRRNYYQVAWSNSVYAVTTIDDGHVNGGTAWAIQMYLDRDTNHKCYVFCQDLKHWFKWDQGFVPIDEPPFPSGVWAGIGSRDLTSAGKSAIRTLMKYSPPAI